MADSDSHVFDAMIHVVLMRMIECGISMPDDDYKAIALGLVIELERRIRKTTPTP